ncbi:MAG: hypothetical protein CEN87_239 [Parcubacteria group bacterium Licking1014_1]|nr:MAG: hypothetical protein CEN87_239 [Parcubacteria group bacterium Licking1014_1]
MAQKHYIFIGVLILAVLAGIFSYPVVFNKGVDFLNQKFSWTLPHFWERPYVLGLDLQGGVNLVYQADLSGVQDKAVAMAGLRDIIERRVNMFGVSESVVQTQGQDRLIVELPGVKDVGEAIKMIGETPYLEFLELRTEEETQQILDKIKEVQGKNPYFKPTELTGKYLKRAQVIFDQTTYKPEIELQFDGEGAKIFEEITARNIKNPLAIFLDGGSIIDTTGDGKIDAQDTYAPIVQDKITGGKAVITGNMNTQTANDIARRLNSGALPVKIGAPISQETIGPALGTVSLQKSLWAGMLGFLAILLFMIIFYRVPGFFASFSLLIYVFLMLSFCKLIPVTLTLAGIAGFLLSMGMAVDANILIFSRMREELKQGKSYLLSLEDGLRRAWPSIRDGNFTTILVGLILFLFGTSFVKGFAFTLIIGNLIGIFTAVIATNYLLKCFSKEKSPKWLWLWR